MSAVDRFRKTLTTSLSRGGKTALTALGAAFERADELGGEARDAIVDWAQTSPAAARVKQTVQQVKGRIESMRAKPESQIDPTAERVRVDDLKEPPSLGDPSIPVQLFGGASCPWTGRARRLLEDRQIEFAFTDLDDEGGDALASQLVCETRQNTVPYVFVRGEFVGGFNALDELDRLGQLEARLSTSDGEGGRVKIEVAKRPNTDEVAPGASSRPVDEAPPESS